ncbi:short-chain dehydrogenase [Rhodocyclaceae bacterium]|nr:short-chain dehydrogenase [Rhodocyclaceae bacterium]
MKRILIFGATSAIASACARQWVARGYHIFLVARNQEKLSATIQDLRVRSTPVQIIEGFAVDLNCTERHPELLEMASNALGGIDIVLIAHGTLPDQKSCQNSVALTLDAVQTNALSAISILTVAANRLERERCGTLAVISSVAGDRGRQSNYIYGASKGMLTVFLQGLRNRLASSGVQVLTIKPGFVDTPMTADFKKSALWAQPEDIAHGILKAIDKKKDIVYLPLYWRWIMLIITHIPEAIFKRLSL